MNTVIGIVVIVVGLICWIGQTLALLAPHIAVKLGLCEPEEEMDHTLYTIETKAHGLTDLLLTWTLPVAGLLIILDHSFWPILALIGGGIYLYFPGIISFHRVFLKKHGIKMGSPSAIKATYVFSIIWVLSALTMIILAIKQLNS